MSDKPKDPKLKGVKGGNCNRTACQQPGAEYFNASTRAYYCKDCARRINETAPGLCSLTVRTYIEWTGEQLTESEVRDE